jgi:hypothetical protein
MSAQRIIVRYRCRLLVIIAGSFNVLACQFAEAQSTRFHAVLATDQERMFRIAGAGDLCRTSADGVTWAMATATAAPSWRSLCRGNDASVRIDREGRLWSSLDGTNWMARNARVLSALHRVAFGSGRFVAVGNEGALISSDDGVVWTPQNSGTDERLRGVAHGKGSYVVVGYAGTILTSRDGIRWHRRRSRTDVRLLDVAFGNGIFVAVGWHGAILTSRDGSRWHRVSSGTPRHLCRVEFADASGAMKDTSAGGDEPTMTRYAIQSPYNLVPFPAAALESEPAPGAETVLQTLRWRAGTVDYLDDVWDVVNEPYLDLSECTALGRFLRRPSGEPVCHLCLTEFAENELHPDRHGCVLLRHVRAKWPAIPIFERWRNEASRAQEA